MEFKINRGKIPAPVRAVIYGAEGVGKSTLASNFPEPLFIDIEDGTKELDVARIDKPENWRMLLDELDYIALNPDLCKTVIIDTADRAEQLLTAALLLEGGVDSIEKYGGGYGKGYTALAERFTKDLLFRLDTLIANGINCVLLAHAIMRKFEAPDEPPYDRWELKVSKKVAPLLKEWSDLLLFCNYKAMIVEENGKNKAKGSGKRVMYANHKPTYDAKNRYGLPDEMELSYTPLKPVFDRTLEKKPEKTELRVDTPTDGIVEGDLAETLADAFRRNLEANGITEEECIAYLKKRKKIGKNGTLEDLSDTYLHSLDDNIEMLKKEIEKGRK